MNFVYDFQLHRSKYCSIKKQLAKYFENSGRYSNNLAKGDFMNNSILVLIGSLMLTSMNAAACPDLSGNYQKDDGSKRMVLQMSTIGAGISTINMGGPESITIDGQPHAIPGSPATYIASCTDTDVSIQFSQGGVDLGTLTYSKTADGLKEKSVGMQNSDETFIKVN